MNNKSVLYSNECQSRNISKLEHPSQIIREIEYLCESIISDCRKNRLTGVLRKIDQVMDMVNLFRSLPTGDDHSSLTDMFMALRLVDKTTNYAFNRGRSLLN